MVAEIEFVQAPPGMMDLRSYTLNPLDEEGYLFAMRSVDHPEIRLFLVPPQAYFPDYAPPLDAGSRLALGLGDEAPLLLAVVHPGSEGNGPTANLLAPVVINPTTGSALQVVLDSDEWPLRAQFRAA
ncbi:flagellar assembly protein FliW [Actinotalea sp.]|uniref:flagellar assembly protein FliW n=1 Tax=Actinotalea sp. TaxID=1872145 RepID=UPI0035662EF3